MFELPSGEESGIHHRLSPDNGGDPYKQFWSVARKLHLHEQLESADRQACVKKGNRVRADQAAHCAATAQVALAKIIAEEQGSRRVALPALPQQGRHKGVLSE